MDSFSQRSFFSTEVPGTVPLSHWDSERRHTRSIILQPHPSDDPNDPLNWSNARKGVNLVLICVYTVLCFATLTVSGPLWFPMGMELGFTTSQLTNAYASNNAALAVGCIIFIPLALKYGRRPVYILSSLLLTLFSIWGALQKTPADLFLSSIFSGLAAATNETLIQLTVADMFFVHQRGSVNGLYLLMVTIGNFLSPVASGYVATSQGWRWAYWWCVILMGITCVLLLLFYEETKFHPPTITGRPSPAHTHIPQTQLGDKPTTNDATLEPVATGTSDSLPGLRIDQSIPKKSYRQRFALVTNSPGSFNTIFRHVWQPFVLLALFPAVAFTALQYAASVSWIGIVATTQSILYPAPPYNFQPSAVGLLNLPPFIGALLGSIWGGPLSDYYIIWRASRNKGIYEPEMRLPMFLLPALATPAGMLCYGLTTARGYHWIIPCIGAGFMGFGITAVSDISLTFLVDSYKEIIGDALIGVAFVRNALSTALVFGISPWMTNMGVYNMFVVAGIVCLAICLLFIPMMVWGKTARAKMAHRYAFYAARQYESRGI